MTLQVTHNWHVWLPMAYMTAIGFIAEWWKGAGYIIEHDAFTGNEQLVIKTLSEVLLVLKVSQSARR